MRQLMVVAVLLAVAMPAARGAEVQETPNTAGALFGTRENVQAIDISPDGNRVVYITPGVGRNSAAYIADLAKGGAPRALITSNGDPDRLAWCNFVSNERLICQIGGVVELDGVLVPYSRLITIDSETRKATPLGQRGSRHDAELRQFDGDILDWLPDEDGAVLMARDYVPEGGNKNPMLLRKENGLGVDRIDLATLQFTRVENVSKGVDYYISDGRGNVRIKAYVPREGSGQLSPRVVYHYRLPDSKEWQRFSTWEDGAGMKPIEVDGAANCAYVHKSLDGRLALYRVKLDGSMATELVYKNDKVDVDGVVRIGRGSRVIGATFAEEKRKTIYFDPEYRKLAAALGKAIPNSPLISFMGSSAGESRLLIHAGSDSDPGRYYVYDKIGRTLNEILVARPSLEAIQLASVKPIVYPAGDGTPVPAYLTLPPGSESARGLPAVVLPHGGPSARDEWGFDWLAQFLAYQGYAVLQPNYRGSAGFGDAWLQENGFKSWRTSIGDVTAAAKWMVTQGIADPDKLAIVGWSYGGYAALQSGVTEPTLFKALVAIAPVTDLEMVKQDAREYTNRRLVAREIGEGAHVAEGSPLQNVEMIRAPVLMFHGDLDVNVGVQQSRKMDGKLRRAGKASELMVYEGLDHSLVDSTARAQMLDRIAAFLSVHIGK
jgi:dipeptidyl aminopeptidase/acylaminoacyl peptidase